MRVCPEPGCPNLQPCTQHTKQAWASSNRRDTLPGDWQKLRSAVLRRDKGICQLHHPGCTVRATEVHHLDGHDQHELHQLTSTCPPCHKIETQREATAARTSRGGVPPLTRRRPAHVGSPGTELEFAL